MKPPLVTGYECEEGKGPILGSTATVWFARSKDTHEPVIIKRWGADMQDLVLETGDLLQDTSSPHILRTLHVGYDRAGGDEDLICSVHERLYGQTLKQWSTSKPTIQECEALLSSMLYGLQDAHAHNIVHGDLSPENVMFRVKDKPDTAVILDWCISEDIEPPPQYLYSAPECILKGEAASKASDVYGAAMLICYVYFGRVPLPTETREGVFDFYAEHTHETGVSIPKKDVRLARTLASMLSPNPEERASATVALEMMENPVSPLIQPSIKTHLVLALGSLVLLSLGVWATPTLGGILLQSTHTRLAIAKCKDSMGFAVLNAHITLEGEYLIRRRKTRKAHTQARRIIRHAEQRADHASIEKHTTSIAVPTGTKQKRSTDTSRGIDWNTKDCLPTDTNTCGVP